MDPGRMNATQNIKASNIRIIPLINTINNLSDFCTVTSGGPV
jgi:hypothetical protein